MSKRDRLPSLAVPVLLMTAAAGACHRTEPRLTAAPRSSATVKDGKSGEELADVTQEGDDTITEPKPKHSDGDPLDSGWSTDAGGDGGNTSRCPAAMVLITGTKPLSKATKPLADYCLDRTEVTTDAYYECVRNGYCMSPGPMPPCNEPKSAGQHPVNCVTLADAVDYCTSRKARVPSADEWKYAAGARRGTIFPWGDQLPGDRACWSGGAKRTATCAIGSFPKGASPEGALDLAGNVMELAADGDARGGSYETTNFMGLSFNFAVGPLFAAIRSPMIGFRCAATPLLL